MTPDTHWSGSKALPFADTADCKEPAAIAVGEVLHAVWTQNKSLYHAILANENWSEPKAIAIGGQAALAVTPDGSVHCLFAAEMFGNVEIYLATWNGTTVGTAGVRLAHERRLLLPRTGRRPERQPARGLGRYDARLSDRLLRAQGKRRLDQHADPERHRPSADAGGGAERRGARGLAEPAARYQTLRHLLRRSTATGRGACPRTFRTPPSDTRSIHG